MLKLTYQLISSQEFIQTIRKIGASPTIPGKAAYTVGKVIQVVERTLPKLAEQYRDILKQHCELDATGNVKPQVQKLTDKDGKEVEFPIPGSFIPLAGKEAEIQGLMDKFLANEIEIQQHKIPVSALDKVGLTPLEFATIDPLVTEVELVK